MKLYQFFIFRKKQSAKSKIENVIRETQIFKTGRPALVGHEKFFYLQVSTDNRSKYCYAKFRKSNPIIINLALEITDDYIDYRNIAINALLCG